MCFYELLANPNLQLSYETSAFGKEILKILKSMFKMQETVEI